MASLSSAGGAGGPDRALRFYFSLRSPYSWLAYRDLMAEHRDIVERLTWIPFWEPDPRSLQRLTDAGGSFPYVDMSRPKARYILGDVRRLAAARRLTLTWPIDHQPWWEVAHLAYLVARRHDAGPRFIARTYQARWEEGRDISDRDTIADIGVELGLPRAEVYDAVDDPEIRDEGLAALLAIWTDGVFGVPFFIHGRDKYWGVDRLAAFAAAVRNDRPAPPPSAAAGPATRSRGEAWLASVGRTTSRPTADEGHAGGCG